jgi:hypothetical protein
VHDVVYLCLDCWLDIVDRIATILRVETSWKAPIVSVVLAVTMK